MTTNYPVLFNSIKIGTVHINNRIVVPPMANFQIITDGLINHEYLDYYEKYASASPGIIFIEACAVQKPRNTLILDDDIAIEGMSKLFKCISKHNSIAIVQLFYNISSKVHQYIRKLSQNNINNINSNFISAAFRCKQAGFHGIELHAAHGFYLNQLM